MEKVFLKDGDGLAQAVAVLGEGGVVMHPTETCYGLAVDIFNESALRRLYFLKNMPLDKLLSIMVADLEMAREYGDFSRKALALAKKHWPGPLTIVVPRTKLLPVWFNPREKFVGIRLSGMKFCRDMVKKLGEPVTTTSANFSGDEPFYRPGMMPGVDLILDAGEIAAAKPSTVVKVDGSKFKVLREGDIVIKGSR